MSNLSELLPTGGGQNAVDFVASGTLASGQTVALKADGTVEAVTGVTEGGGSSVIFASSKIYWPVSTFDSNSNKVVIAYRNADNSNYGTAVVGTVSGTSISFGTPVVFESSLTNDIGSTFDSNSNKVVIAYRATSNYGYAVVGTVSGTSISFGTSVAWQSSRSYYPACTFDSNSNRVVISYSAPDNASKGTAIVGTVSGTSISFGSPVLFQNSTVEYSGIGFDSTSNKIIIAYGNAGAGTYGTAIVGTVSGTSISFGTAVVFLSDASYNFFGVAFDPIANKIVIGYQDYASSNLNRYGTAIVGTVSGTSISFGTPVRLNTAPNVGFIGAVFDSTSNKVVFTYVLQASSPNNGAVSVGTVSGTSISFGTPTLFDSGNVSDPTCVFDSSSNKVVISYKSSTTNNYGLSVVFTVGSSNNTDFIGITAEAISDTATGPVNVYGGINAVQTGLTIASDYYVQDDGSLAAGVTSIPYDISGATYTQNFSVSSQDTSPQGLAFSPDGTKMFMVGYADDRVFQYALSTAFDISTASYSSIYFSVAAQETIPRGLAFSVDGGKMFVLGTTADQVFEYTLSSAFNVSTASFVDAFSVAAQETDPQGIAFSTDGAKMFITGHTGQDVNEYALSTVFDVSTASYTQNFSISGQETQPTGIAFNSAGTKMFIIGVTGQDVNEYTLSTGFNVSTASFSGITFSVATQETSPQAVVFNTTGTNFYVLGASGDDINQYAVSQTTFVTTVKAGQAISATTINLMDLT